MPNEDTVHVSDPHAEIVIRRDGFGVPHVQADDEHDAWFGLGFASAQDRLWQMEYDRRRAVGRWSEAAGSVALPADRLARRMQLEAAARADVAAMSADTRAAFEAYAAGVNAFLLSGAPLPPEYGLTEITPEPWQPWHSVVAFKIRHVLMGVWQRKLAEALLLQRIGPDAYQRLEGTPWKGSPVILPPGGQVTALLVTAADELAAAAEHLGFLSEVDAGSNSWAVHGSRTTTGKPVLCNDSHRALDVPNVYWQAHLSCPAFDVIGATFPGFPGFPHFGHNGHVAWNITHAMADTQDLYVELFDRADPKRYRVPGGWAPAERRSETIQVRGGEPVAIELIRTRHGPVVHGDPRSGYALALRYIATDEPCRQFEALGPMLVAKSVEELQESQRVWVDPANNLLCADTAGSIGYLTRGRLPLRPSQLSCRFPVFSPDDEEEWQGNVPFERMPRAISPPEGFIATANQQTNDGKGPYVGTFFAVPWRAQRIVELLQGRDTLSPAVLAAMQSDRVSCAARAWVAFLAKQGSFAGDAESARQMLAGWDANLLPESNAALLYGCFRRAIARALFAPVVGAQTWQWLASEAVPTTGSMIQRWLAGVVWSLEQGGQPPSGQPWSAVLPEALDAAWRRAAALGGPDPARWRWADHHANNAQHTLAATFPNLAAELNPPRAAVGGDGETIQAANYGWREDAPFAITGLSVYRQVVDLADIAHATAVIPGGESAVPGSPHYADQLPLWRTHRRIPLHYEAADVEGAMERMVRLVPDKSSRPPESIAR